MNLIKLCMIAMIGVTVTMFIKQWKTDFLPLVRMGMTVLFSIAIFTAATPLFHYLRTITETNTLSEYAEILFKALGVALLTQTCADICRESGEAGIAGSVELMGKVELLLLALPFLHKLLSAAQELLSLGGNV